MATRRILSQEKTLIEKDDTVGSSPAANEKSNIAPAVPTSVIMKLLAFTLGMIVIPIGSYFLTVDTVFMGNSTYAGVLAAIMANAVLIGYIFVAMAEDQSEQLPQQAAAKGPGQEGKKDR
ncbi:hypothetical protein N657DRAFT_587586 [Parathielavia appendiculata]|uniref:Vacuolar ATPase assembly integral membrane protein VMA21 n=1 Tax=Parathielavia appendiculata TaxID=2587402 RepID=A0AAN6UAN5_9PEZI|nr:hypothetical protein N657DRAFT_587586 [Parathielavia appendiculata]